MTNLPLIGSKVRLRDWIIEDVEMFAKWLQPGHRWQALDGPYYKKPTEDEIPTIIERTKKRIQDNQFPDPRSRLVIADAQTNQMLGQVTHYWISQETYWLAAGIVIYDPDQWGQGLGFDSLGLWTDYIFASMPKLVRLDLQTWSGNAGLMRLAEKLGYQLEGCFRKARIVNGEYYDALGYGILREEWQALHPTGFGK